MLQMIFQPYQYVYCFPFRKFLNRTAITDALQGSAYELMWVKVLRDNFFFRSIVVVHSADTCLLSKGMKIIYIGICFTTPAKSHYSQLWGTTTFLVFTILLNIHRVIQQYDHSSWWQNSSWYPQQLRINRNWNFWLERMKEKLFRCPFHIGKWQLRKMRQGIWWFLQ